MRCDEFDTALSDIAADNDDIVTAKTCSANSTTYSATAKSHEELVAGDPPWPTFAAVLFSAADAHNNQHIAGGPIPGYISANMSAVMDAKSKAVKPHRARPKRRGMKEN